MSSRSIVKATAAVSSTILAASLLSGCGGGGSDTSFTVALIEPDTTTVPLLAAVDAVREEGFDITVEEAAEPELAIEGLVRGDYQFSAESTSPALIAISKGAPIRIVADVVGNRGRSTAPRAATAATSSTAVPSASSPRVPSRP